VYICGSYRQSKPGYHFLDHPVYTIAQLLHWKRRSICSAVN